MGNVRDYAIITGTYWVFTVTDGALRMLVLLALYQLGHSPMAIASLFVFYEFFGVVTNGLGGYIGARFGLKMPLGWGLALQVVACSMLTVDEAMLTLAYVMVAQALSGVAKDLTKMSAKSYVKLVVPQGDSSRLMRWVSVLTGSKNTLKGVGYFVGALLLDLAGFGPACAGMAVAVALALAVSMASLPKAPGKATSKLTWASLVPRDPRVRWLSVARFFLFGSRDVWFVLALPLFLTASLSWTHQEVGAFLALWIIGYGIVQAASPHVVGGAGNVRLAPRAGRLGRWTLALLVPLLAIEVALDQGLDPGVTLVVGLAVFGFIFAANSAIHSYLIVAYAASDTVSLQVGFYYMANAAGRLVGTALSGVIFQAAGMGVDGLAASIGVSVVLVCAARLAGTPLARAEHPVQAAPGS